MIQMAEFWARNAADCGGHIAVAPFSRRVSPRCIILHPALRASSSDLLGDGLDGFTHIISRTETAEHMGGSGSVSRSSSARPSLSAKDGVSSMHAAYSIGKPDGVGLALVFRNAPGLTQAIWGQAPVKSGTGQLCEGTISGRADIPAPAIDSPHAD